MHRAQLGLKKVKAHSFQGEMQFEKFERRRHRFGQFEAAGDTLDRILEKLVILLKQSGHGAVLPLGRPADLRYKEINYSIRINYFPLECNSFRISPYICLRCCNCGHFNSGTRLAVGIGSLGYRIQYICFTFTGFTAGPEAKSFERRLSGNPQRAGSG
jgi:hypothetical protein